MTQPNEIHQIEYRWEHQQDLVPIASSLEQGAKQSWDALIYSWVRHPDAEVTPESVRYQRLTDGRAVLAWRYRDPEAAKRRDGTQGRPIVSRVFVAQPGLLTPDIAIALCRTGLPPSAGPRPGEVSQGDSLPWLAAGELRNLTEDWAEKMDREAGADPGLAELVAAALAEPGLPLAVQLGQPHLSKPPGSGPQPRLLWGVWRIGRPLLGDDGRGWSFSTFEAPLGDSDPARLPDIVFRLDQPVHHAPSRARAERQVRPYNPGTPAILGRHPEMPAWLVEEYQTRGGEPLGGMLAECEAGAPLHERLDALYDRLRAGRRLPPKAAAEHELSHDATAGSGEPEPRHEQGRQDVHHDRNYAGEAYQSQEAERQAPAVPTYPQRQYRANEYQPVPYEPVTYTPPQPAQEAYPPEPWQPPPLGADRAALQPPRTEPAPALHLPDQPAGPPAGQRPDSGPGAGPGAGQALTQEPRRRPGPSHHVATASELLRQLTTASDAQEFRSVLDRIHQPSVQFEQSDRRQACHEMQDCNWYIPDLLRYNYVPCEHELAAIFRVTLLLDLGLVQVPRQIAGWIAEAAEREIRPLIRALLLAPRDDDAQKRMRTILRSGLAVRLIVHYDCEDLWPAEPEPQISDSSESSTSGLRRRLFSRGSRD